MRIFMYGLVCLLVLWGTGCGKGQDELVSFADQIAQLKGYNETLTRYLHLVETTPENPGEAHQVGKVLEEYRAAVSGISRPNDITLRSLHNRYLRSIEKAQERIKLPGHPMFALESRRAIRDLQSEVEKIYETLDQILQRENLGERYTLKWPTPGE